MKMCIHRELLLQSWRITDWAFARKTGSRGLVSAGTTPPPGPRSPGSNHPLPGQLHQRQEGKGVHVPGWRPSGESLEGIRPGQGVLPPPPEEAYANEAIRELCERERGLGK